jgi:ribonuclease E
MKDNTAQVVAQVPVDVATFLLNEKRNDVFSIESRFKVNVLLVPNRHLETPNYTIERLRHDDLNGSEPLPVSFQMVEQPADADPIQVMKEEAREPRQEAVVKGITPAQPAPLPVERIAAESVARRATYVPAEPESWLSRMLSWFRAKPETTTAPAAPAAVADSAGARDARATESRREGRARGDARREGQRRDERRGEGRDRREGRGSAAGGREGREARGGAPAQRGNGEGRGEPREQRRDRHDERRGEARDARRGEESRERHDEARREPRREGERRDERRDGDRDAAREGRRDEVREPRRDEVREPRRDDAREPRRDDAREPRRDEHRERQDARPQSERTGQPRPARERSEGEPVAEAAGVLTEPAPGASGSAQEHREGGRRRRGRRGRGGDRGERTVEGTAHESALAESGELRTTVGPVTTSYEAPTPAHEEQREHTQGELNIERAVHAPEQVVSPVSAEAVPIATPQRERELAHRHDSPAPLAQAAEPAPAELPKIETPKVEPPKVELPTVSLSLPAGSDLVMVETAHHGVAETQADVETPRPRRVRPPRAQPPSEPLEMVETRNDPSPPGQ